MIEIEKVGVRIWMRAPYKLSGVKNAIPGANFSERGEPHWSLPLTMEVCHLLRERYGSQLSIGQELWAWATEQNAMAKRAEDLRTAKTMEVPRIAEAYPVLAKAVTEGRPYQSVGARWIADQPRGRGVLIGDTVGLGKTPQALAGVAESGVAGPYLIVCPKTAIPAVWEREVPRWLPGHEVVTVPDGRAKRDAILNALVAQEPTSLARTWVAVHPEMVRTQSWWICALCGSRTKWTTKPTAYLDCEHPKDRRTKIEHEHTFPQLFQLPWGAVVADESDRMILRTKGTPTLTRRGMELIRDEAMREDGLRVAQSGTPFRSRPHLLWSTLNWLRPQEFTSFWNWAETYFEITDGWGGSRKIGRLREERAEMLWRSLDKVMLRRTRAEVAKHLPPMAEVGARLVPEDPHSPERIWLPMEPQQAKAYKQMLDLSVAELEGGELTAVGILAEMTRLKQFATSAGRMVNVNKAGELHPEFRPALPSNKLNYIIQMLEELGYPDDPQGKVVIVSQFTQILDLFGRELAAKFGDGMVTYITGSVTGQRRLDAQDRFNEEAGTNSPHIMMLNTKAGGAAITLDSADDMVFIDETWIPDETEQAKGRIDNRRPEHRISQRRFRRLCSLGTIDEGITVVNAERDETGRMILDGRRGVKLAREIIAPTRREAKR